MILTAAGIWKWRHRATSDKETGYEDIMPKLNIISIEDFKKSSHQEKYVAEVLRLIRSVNIYPIYYFSDKGIRQEIAKCRDYRTSFPVENGRAGSILLDFMFPNLHLADSGNSVNNCLYSRFYDDEKLSKCLTRHMKHYRFTNMRTPFFMYGRYFWSTATNFSCMRSKAVYQQFCNPGDIVYDSSAGYGSRMLGALTTDIGLTYIGCEPNMNTFANLNRLGEYLNSYELYQIGSEDIYLEPHSVDFAFTCPPYFGVERYSEERTQSIVKFPVYKDWLEGYVRPTLQTTYNALKPGSRAIYVLAQNIYYMNVKYPLGIDWTNTALETGFRLEDKINVSSMSRKQRGNAENYYVFRK